MEFLVPILLLVVLGTMLALAESSISRTTLGRATALLEQGRRNAALLARIEEEPERYLNAVYLAVMGAQNGSAILVAVFAERNFGDLGLTLISVAFTLGYFVVVEAMAKTFGILHSDTVALAMAPFVWLVGRTLSLPSRALIGLANVLLPGKGLKTGPFVTRSEIRTLADVGLQEGSIAGHEREMIHSVVGLGGRTVGEVMVPRPDVIAIEVSRSLQHAVELLLEHRLTRLPVYRGDLDHTEGIIHVKDVLETLYKGQADAPLVHLLRPVRFVPESKRLGDLLREMQADKFHMAMVTDEYGLVAGAVTLEDLLEEIVGQIRDEHDEEPIDILPLDHSHYRVNAAVPITELNDALHANLPRQGWNTVGGLVYGIAGKLPVEGETVALDGFRFTVEKLQGRRIVSVLVERLDEPAEPDLG